MVLRGVACSRLALRSFGLGEEVGSCFAGVEARALCRLAVRSASLVSELSVNDS